MPASWMPIATRHQTYNYLLQGRSIRATSKALNVSRYAVVYNKERIDETGKLINRKRSGLAAYSPVVQTINKMIINNNTNSKKEIRKALILKGYYLTLRQIRYRIQILGFKWKKAKKVQVISATNQERRMQHHAWYCATGYQFNQHIFSDETYFIVIPIKI
uniref:Transposase n=1 Tax=Panagrolaimus sp. PS1159 TaxID=55785 RepID=A0AC35F4H1_9BILA